MLDARRFAGALKACMDLYGRPLTADVLDLYARALARFETEDVLRALEIHLLDPDVGQFPPKPADIVRRIQGSNTTGAARAWARVVDAVRIVGAWRTVIFDDPLIHACISQMGGWIKICQMREDEAPFRGKDFERLYLGYKQQGTIPQFPAKLIGRAEAGNVERGLPVDPAVLIGEPERAKLVHQAGRERSQMLPEIISQIAL